MAAHLFPTGAHLPRVDTTTDLSYLRRRPKKSWLPHHNPRESYTRNLYAPTRTNVYGNIAHTANQHSGHRVYYNMADEAYARHLAAIPRERRPSGNRRKSRGHRVNMII